MNTLYDMDTFYYVVIFSVIGGIFSLIGGIWLLGNKRSAELLARYATPFAGGALLAAVFLDLLKEGIEQSSSDTVLLATLVGIVLFFLAEGFLKWFHHHHEEDDHGKQEDASASLVVVGDTLHNALDGVAIAASFLISVPTGIVTTIAVAAHEIPQEIGDFGLLLSKGYSRKKVLIVNLLSAMATVAAAIVTYLLGSSDKLPIGIMLGLSAGFLLYIAASDIIPSIHDSGDGKKPFNLQALLFVIGILVVGVSITLAHNYIDAGDQHSQNSQVHQHDDGTHPHWPDPLD